MYLNKLPNRWAPWLLLLSWLVSGPLPARELRVCPSCAFVTIQEAIEQAKPKDRILIAPGLYKEHSLVIDKPLSIEGSSGTVLDGQKQGHIFEIRAEGVSISGLELQNVGHSYTQEFAAIMVKDTSQFVIRNNVLKKVFFGIKVDRSTEGLIEGNRVTSENKSEAGAGNGIHLWHCNKIQVRNNDLSYMRDGIYFEFVKHSEISQNRSHNNIRYGLHFMFSNHNKYFDNRFYQNGAGVAVMFSKFIEMRRNLFENNWGTASYGLLLKEIYDAKIADNVFEKNTIAINTEGSTRIQYFHNDFLRNGWALKVRGACYKNIYKMNNFIGNAFDVSYNSNFNDNEFDANYWDQYSGYDLNRDGTGDVPHPPVKLFSYIVNQTPETVVLLRSMFVSLINFAEKVSPIFTPRDILDHHPAMKPYIFFGGTPKSPKSPAQEDGHA